MAVDMETWRSIDGSDGIVSGPFIHIRLQRGSIHEVGAIGCRIEVLQDRLPDHQGRSLACEVNATTLKHLALAHEALLLRRWRREHQGVLNTAEPHNSA